MLPSYFTFKVRNPLPGRVQQFNLSPIDVHTLLFATFIIIYLNKGDLKHRYQHFCHQFVGLDGL